MSFGFHFVAQQPITQSAAAYGRSYRTPEKISAFFFLNCFESVLNVFRAVVFCVFMCIHVEVDKDVCQLVSVYLMERFHIPLLENMVLAEYF